jgi:predicted transcriptional regulator
MLIKEQVEEVLHYMPNQFNVDEIFDKLILLDKIQQGLQDSNDGKVYTEEEASKRLEKWLS